MKRLSERRSKTSLWLLAGAALLLASGCPAWRIRESVELARASEPWQQSPEAATLRLLIVGDSTGVGTGATSPGRSLAGLIGKSHPRLFIENRAEDGAKFADVQRQLGAGGRFDIVLVQAGGNDVIRLRELDALRTDIDRVADLALQRASLVILMPAGNVGNAPFFFAPVSWSLTRRSRAMHGFVKDAAARTGATYVNLFHERADDPFVVDKSLNASDGLHPSDAGYEVWLRALMAQSDLSQRLSRAAGG
jgi:lysophospholipase L1-like esterase